MRKAFLKAAEVMDLPHTHRRSCDGACIALSQVGASYRSSVVLKKIFAPDAIKLYWLGPAQKNYRRLLSQEAIADDDALRQLRVYALLIAAEIWKDFT